MTETRALRTRYPFRAVLAVAATALLALFELILMATCLMPLVPLIPVFITMMLGNACLLSAALGYATSLARVEPVSTGRAETPEARKASRETEASHAA